MIIVAVRLIAYITTKLHYSITLNESSDGIANVPGRTHTHTITHPAFKLRLNDGLESTLVTMRWMWNFS